MKCDDYRANIKNRLAKKVEHSVIAREIYLSYPTFSFGDHPEKEFLIKNGIAEQFGVDIFSVHFGGSAKTGESYHKTNKFEFGKSDLDAAIISPSLFLKYLEFTCVATNNFSNLTSFDTDEREIEMFRRYLLRGILIPDLMPSCDERLAWKTYFNNLSAGNISLFDNINCWIYSTQKIFEMKFAATVKILESRKK
jgi:hypothetical protein